MATPTDTLHAPEKPTGWLKTLGPGLITGASDDDPSGIATYSQVGAQFGYGLGWTLLLSYPFMSAIQEACARIGRVTGRGLATNIVDSYPRSIAYGICLLLLSANTINAAADLGAMAAALQLLIGGPAKLYVIAFGVVTSLLITFVSYERYASYLKWLCLSLFAYVATAFAVHVPWLTVAKALVWPQLSLSHAYVTAVVAVFGTTISPYLFFWQAAQEAERQQEDPAQQPLLAAPRQARRELGRIRLDTYIGMALSNLIAIFIVITTAATLHAAGQTDIATSSQAAEALRPIAGNFAFAIFAAGIVGTGMLGVPVLVGSAAFALCGFTRQTSGLSRTLREAPLFYGVIAGSLLIAIILNSVDIDPIKALFWSAVINGLVAVPVMCLIMLLSRNRHVMKSYRLSPWLTFLGWSATLFMAALAVAMVVGWFAP
jgi:NRAMP (natural resistance-associated macrophage protein)-like metal ion transporter